MKARYFIYVNDDDAERFVEVKLAPHSIIGRRCNHWPMFEREAVSVCLICDAGLEGTPLTLITTVEE